MCVFDLSLVATRVDAWNNLLLCEGGATPTELSWVQNAGVLHLRGTNLAHGTLQSAAYGADPEMYTIDQAGSLLTGDPLLKDLDVQDLRLKPDSPAIDRATGIPDGVPAEVGASHPLLGQPRVAANGWETRTQVGDAPDLGAIEFQP